VSETAVNAASRAFCERCGTPIEATHGRRFCGDRCRLLHWALQQETPQRRLEFGPTAAKVENKRSGKRAAILARLESGPARTWDLMLLGGAGFSSRIRELRVEGHRIECEQDEDGALYTLDAREALRG